MADFHIYCPIISSRRTTGGIVMTEIERIRCGFKNAYLVTQNGRSILVDTCARQDRKRLFAACKGKKIIAIFLTHGHCDHTGNAAYLSRELNAPIAMSKADFPMIANCYDQPLTAHTGFGKFIQSLTMKEFEAEHTEQFSPKLFVEDGFRFDDYGVSAKVISLEGHTRGSLGLQVDDGCGLIVGDALANFFYPISAPIYGDRRRAAKTADMIAKMGEDVMIYFGHGSPIKNRKKYK